MEKEFVFNYETPETAFWRGLQDDYGYRTRYPAPGENGTIKLTF